MLCNVNAGKLKHIRFHLNTNFFFLIVRVLKNWSRLPREVLESPSMEVFKTRLDTILGNLL